MLMPISPRVPHDTHQARSAINSLVVPRSFLAASSSIRTNHRLEELHGDVGRRTKHGFLQHGLTSRDGSDSRLWPTKGGSPTASVERASARRLDLRCRPGSPRAHICGATFHEGSNGVKSDSGSASSCCQLMNGCRQCKSAAHDFASYGFDGRHQRLNVKFCTVDWHSKVERDHCGVKFTEATHPGVPDDHFRGSSCEPWTHASVEGFRMPLLNAQIPAQSLEFGHEQLRTRRLPVMKARRSAFLDRTTVPNS